MDRGTVETEIDTKCDGGPSRIFSVTVKALLFNTTKSATMPCMMKLGCQRERGKMGTNLVCFLSFEVGKSRCGLGLGRVHGDGG